MLNEVRFYIDDRGRQPVRDFIDAQPLKDQVKILAYLEELKKQGHNLRRPVADYLGEGIYELRPKHNRIFYFFFSKGCVVLLHALRRRTDKIPTDDLALCIKRREQVESFSGVGRVETGSL
jgi:phage-related protein